MGTGTLMRSLLPDWRLVPEFYEKAGWCGAMVFKLCSLEPQGFCRWAEAGFLGGSLVSLV